METWKTVIVNGEVYNNYMVSNWGNVKSLNYNHTGREKILKPRKNKGNYLQVALCKNGKVKRYSIHRLVAEAFIPKIEGKEFVDHINGIRDDNRIDNLRWCTHKENHNFDLFRKHMSEANSKKVLCIELNKIFGSTTEAGKELGISQSNISACCRGERKSIGKLNGNKLHWKYVELLPCYNEEVTNND